MKTSFLYTKFLVALFFVAHAPGASAAGEESEKIVKAIDAVCGDSWCEGAFEFRFHDVVMKPAKNETQIHFRMSQHYPVRLEWKDGQSFKAQINQRFHDVSCTLPGFSTYESIMQSEYVLQWGAYTALTECISALEDRLMRVARDL